MWMALKTPSWLVFLVFTYSFFRLISGEKFALRYFRGIYNFVSHNTWCRVKIFLQCKWHGREYHGWLSCWRIRVSFNLWDKFALRYFLDMYSFIHNAWSKGKISLIFSVEGSIMASFCCVDFSFISRGTNSLYVIPETCIASSSAILGAGAKYYLCSM